MNPNYPEATISYRLIQPVPFIYVRVPAKRLFTVPAPYNSTPGTPSHKIMQLPMTESYLLDSDGRKWRRQEARVFNAEENIVIVYITEWEPCEPPESPRVKRPPTEVDSIVDNLL